MADQRDNSDGTGFLWAGLAFIILIYIAWAKGALPALKLYFTHSGPAFEYVIEHHRWFLLTENQLAKFKSYAADMRARRISAHLERLPAAHKDMLTLWGLVVRFPVILFFLFFGLKYIRKPESLRHTGELDFEKLARLNSQTYPYTIPALNARPSELNEYDYHGWEAPRTAIELAVTEGLIKHRKKHIQIPFNVFGPEDITGRKTTSYSKGFMPDFRECTLDIEKCDKYLVKQLGPRFKHKRSDHLDFSHIDPLFALLATIFAGMACGGKTRTEAYDILEQVNRTFKDSWNTGAKRKSILKGKLPPPEPLAERFTWTISRKRIDRLKSAIRRDRVYPYIKRKIESHGYVYTMLSGLLDVDRGGARSKGKAPSSHFIFLRPYSKIAYAHTNAIGGQRPHMDGLAAWTHYQSEKDAGIALYEPSIQGGTDSLHQALFNQEWVYDEELNLSRERDDNQLMQEISRSRELYAAEEKKGRSSVVSLTAKGAT